MNANNKILDLVICSTDCEVSLSDSPISQIDTHHPPLMILCKFDHFKQLPYNNITLSNFNKCK